MGCVGCFTNNSAGRLCLLKLFVNDVNFLTDKCEKRETGIILLGNAVNDKVRFTTHKKLVNHIE